MELSSLLQYFDQIRLQFHLDQPILAESKNGKIRIRPKNKQGEYDPLDLFLLIQKNHWFESLKDNLRLILASFHFVLTSFQFSSSSLNISYRTLRIATFNLGYNVMANVVAGSEKDFVQYCQKKYDGGWAPSDKNQPIISLCTLNATEFLHSYDLFGLQEYHPQYRKGFEAQLSSHRFITGKGVTIGYREDLVGRGRSLNEIRTIGPPGNRRGMQAVWFGKIRLLFINLHAPHRINLPKVLVSELEKIEQAMKKRKYFPLRIIITGDFNDYRGTLIPLQISMMGLHLVIPQTQSAKTCCFDSGYHYPGDYIFDSSGISQFGLPPGYVRMNPPMSDHDPEVLL